MPNLPAAPLPIGAADLWVLRRLAQASLVAASVAQRAKLLLLAAEGPATPPSRSSWASLGRP